MKVSPNYPFTAIVKSPNFDTIPIYSDPSYTFLGWVCVGSTVYVHEGPEDPSQFKNCMAVTEDGNEVTGYIYKERLDYIYGVYKEAPVDENH